MSGTDRWRTRSSIYLRVRSERSSYHENERYLIAGTPQSGRRMILWSVKTLAARLPLASGFVFPSKFHPSKNHGAAARNTHSGRKQSSKPITDRLKWSLNLRRKNVVGDSAQPHNSNPAQARRYAQMSALPIFARTSSVGRTQSIGIEWQRGVGQMTRSGPFPRVPPIACICRPEIILAQIRQ